MIRCKPKGKEKIQISQKQLERIKRELARELTDKITLIYLTALGDEMEDQAKEFDSKMKELRIGKERGEKIKEIFSFNEDFMCNVVLRTGRYSEYIDEHLTKMSQYRDSIKKRTGVDMVGW